ncbi:MAG: ADOP family duplicated permease [Gemmatimonadaceae bacterium]
MSRDRDLDDELAFHLRQAIEERVARGQSREHAEAAARREFGNVTHIKEVTRGQRRGLWLERLVQDVRYGIRSLRRTPAFTVAAILTLALAIGANSAVFTVVHSVVLRPLPFQNADRLFLVSYLPVDIPFQLPPTLADAQWLTYRERQRSFERAAAYNRFATNLSGTGDATRLTGARVTAELFPVLGVAPSLGRAFSRDDESAGRNRVVVLSDRLWRERFGADPRIVGGSITLDGVPHTAIGVMPPGVHFPARSDLWTPLTVILDDHNAYIYSVLGRVRDDVSVTEARTELVSIMQAMPREPGDSSRSIASIVPLKDHLVGDTRSSLLIFSGAVAFVLLIACVNVANLLLIRAASRQREMAVRVALGAGRARIVRQLLTESALVALAGGTLGIVVARVGVQLLLAIAPTGRIPRLDEVRLDWWVVGITIAVSLLTGLAFGLLPALQSARRPPRDAIERGEGARTVGGRQSRLRGVFVSAEVALAVVLLAAAGLMIKSFVRMRSADKGYDATHMMTMSVDLPSGRYADPPRQRAFHASMVERLERMPGVRRAAGVSYRPMGPVGVMGDFVVEGATPLPEGYSVDKMYVTPGYFATMGIRLVRGRDFAVSDDDRAPGVVIVSETVAERVWPNADPIGRRISMQSEPKQPEDWLTVVGVVRDVVQEKSMAMHSTMYQPYQQGEWTFLLSHMTYVVRTEPEAQVASAMRGALRDADPGLPAQQLMSMDDAMMEAVSEPVFQARLLSAFALIALLLAAIGTYGVLAYDVAERSREIALRMALGAAPSDVTRMVLRRTGVLALTGVVVGVAGSLAVTGVLTRWLYQVEPGDPAILATVVIAIMVVALAAGVVPARRATRVDPLARLRAI